MLDTMLSYDGPAVHAGKVAATILGASSFTMSRSGSVFEQKATGFVGTREELDAEMNRLRSATADL